MRKLCAALVFNVEPIMRGVIYQSQSPQNLKCFSMSLFKSLNKRCYSSLTGARRRPFPVLESASIDTSDTVFSSAQKKMESLSSAYKNILKLSMAGGGDKAIKRHKMQKKLLAEERLNLLLDNREEFMELSAIAGMGMEYGDVPRAGVISGIGKVNGQYCVVMVNDATVKGGTIYPITLKKQLRAQEIAEQNRLPCIYVVDSGGAFLPLQAQIFPDRNHGGRIFYNEAILSSLGIPQIAVVCGNCTAGGAYIPTMADEAIIIQKMGRIFLGGPPLVKAATGEVVSVDDLGGAVLHSTISGCTDHYVETEEEAYRTCRDVVASLNADIYAVPHGDAPLFDSQELVCLLPSDIQPFDIHWIIARIVDGSRFHEFKQRYGPTLVTGFSYIEGYLVGIIANQGKITENAALKGAHFVQLCSERAVPLIFLQNTSDETITESDSGEKVKAHAKMMSSVSCSAVPKITINIGQNFGTTNYLMGGRSMNSNFVFLWPNAQVGAMSADQMTETLEQEVFDEADNSENKKAFLSKMKEKFTRETSALYSSSRVWDDGIILPEQTRQVLGQCLRVVSSKHQVRQTDSAVIRM